MRLAVITALWGRPLVAGLMLRHLEEQGARLRRGGIELAVYVVGSEGEQSKLLADLHGAHYLEFPNKPLGKKWNAVLSQAREADPDGVIVLGSDNFVTDTLLLAWAHALDLGVEYAGVLDAFMYSVELQQLIHWPGYDKPERAGEPVGSARLYSRSLLEKLKGGHLWARGWNNSLDWSVTERLKGLPLKRMHVKLSAIGAKQIGVKTPDTMTNHERFLGTQAGRIEKLDRALLVEWFGRTGERILGLG